MLTLDRVYQARQALRPIIHNTDLVRAPYICPSAKVWLKPENLQTTGSFKVRGATFKIFSLTDEEKKRGVIACSAGNHAQGVALASQKCGVKATIYLPSAAPISKVEATKSYGANVVLVDGVYDDAHDAAEKAAKETGAVFVHPYDDEDVIAGQGTIGLELLEQLPDIDAVVIPIGGGGLASGIAFTLKKLKPDVKCYGVQAEGAPSMYNSYHGGKLASLDHVDTFADGISVKTPGDLTFAMCSEYLDDVVTVNDDETATAILTMIEQQKLIAEGAGATSVAAAMFDKLPIKGKNTVCVVSGGNIDVTILSRVIRRGLIKTGRLADLSIELIDRPGQLREVSSIVASLGANVILVNHNYGGENTAINGCTLQISMETRNFDHIAQIRQALADAGYKLLD